MVLRPATRADLSELLEIEEESFAHPRWKALDFLLDDCHVAELEGHVVGFLVSKQLFSGDSKTPPEREILNLAVKPSFRRRGVAAGLLRHELSRKATCFLEVRESNVVAQTLYSRFGFVEVARRDGYYQSPVETAIVMGMK